MVTVDSSESQVDVDSNESQVDVDSSEAQVDCMETFTHQLGLRCKDCTKIVQNTDPAAAKLVRRKLSIIGAVILLALIFIFGFFNGLHDIYKVPYWVLRTVVGDAIFVIIVIIMAPHDCFCGFDTPESAYMKPFESMERVESAADVV